MADERTTLEPPVNDLFLHVARGAIVGWKGVEKFGKRADLPNGSWADLLSGAWNLTWLTSGQTLYISSTEAGDNQEIEIQGVDENFELQTETVTLNGQTKTEIGSGLLWFAAFRAKNKGTSDIAGGVWIYTDGGVSGGEPDTDAQKQLFLDGENQTEHAAYIVPAGYTGYLMGFDFTVGKTQAGECNFRIRVREGESGVFLTKRPAELNTQGKGELNYPYTFALEIPEKSAIMCQAQAQAASLDGTGGFSLLLLKNEE